MRGEFTLAVGAGDAIVSVSGDSSVAEERTWEACLQSGTLGELRSRDSCSGRLAWLQGRRMEERGSLTRRDVLRLGVMASGAALAGALVGCDGMRDEDAKTSPSSDPAKMGRQPKSGEQATSSHFLAGAPPVVDRLAVWALVDNVHDIFLRSATFGDASLRCDVRRYGLGLGPNLKSQLQTEFGLAFHLESAQGEDTRSYLLDFGLSNTALLENMGFLEIDPAFVDALIVSHGHYDHFAGLLPLLSRHRKQMRAGLPLYVGGEDVFCYRWLAPQSLKEPGQSASMAQIEGERQSFGVLDRRKLGEADVRVVMAEQPMVIADQAFTTGAIARTTFETVQPTAQIELGMRDGAGCNASHFTAEEQAGQIVPDQFWGEHAICFHVKDRGLVVISSCGHAGILNTIKAAQAASGVEKIHAVLGGFHLAPTPEPYVAQTVNALKQINPDYLVPMHCSGRAFTRLADAAMPGKIIPPSTGSRFVFGEI